MDGATVFVVDDDDRVREALCRLISSAGYRAIGFASARAFLDFEKPDSPACLVLDLELPDTNGLDLQQELVHRDTPPIVFVTAHGDIPSSVRAMKAGAIDFLSKPFDDGDLLHAIEAGLSMDRTARLKRSELAELQRHYLLLTPREREVLSFVVSGSLIKEMASDLRIAEGTISVHRANLMRKMGARSVAELIRMAAKLGIQGGHSQ